MLEFPAIQELIQELVAETLQKDIVTVLEARFGAVPEELVAELQTIGDEQRLNGLIKHAAVSPDLGSFRALPHSPHDG